jgi:hypothetical protein
LAQYGIASSVGSLALVPSGYPGAGNLIIASYNGAIVYNVPYTIDGSGQYILANKTAEVSVNGIANGPEGIAYIPAGSLAFPNLSMVISSYGDGTVVVFEVGAEGLPNTSTARQMVTGLTGAEGAWIDPLTGDFLFSTFGGGNKIIRITGFEKPSAVGDNPATENASFKLFPNPTTGQVNLEFLKPGQQGVIEIFNSLGVKIMEEEFSGNQVRQFDLSSQPDGMYVMQVRNGETIRNMRFVKK